MKRLRGWFVAAGLVLAAACSDATGPVGVEPTFAKGGGVGSPHFTLEGTSCVLDNDSGLMTCDYQVAGLGKYGSALLTLEGKLDVTYFCAVGAPERETVRLFLKLQVFADQTGNAVGVMTANPVLPVYVCRLWPYASPTDVDYLLDPMAKAGLPTATGEWMLNGVAKTAKGPLTTFYYTGGVSLVNQD